VLLALTTGNKVGLAVTAAVFIAFALASSFLFPRFRPNYPGGALPAFIVVSFVFFFGMLTAVEHFGAESKAETAKIESEASTTTMQQPTTTQTTAAPAHTTTQAQTTAQEQAATVQVTETEFKIALQGYNAKARRFTFDVKNAGHIAHDLAIKGGPKTSLIQPGGTATLAATLKPGRYHLYCTVPGHEQAGMKVDIIVK
jgi:uncharacterized cupredoxin-like copper-binding protein